MSIIDPNLSSGDWMHHAPRLYFLRSAKLLLSLSAVLKCISAVTVQDSTELSL